MNNFVRNKKVIDIAIGNVMQSESMSKIVLLGTYPYKDSKYAENLELIIQSEDNTQTIATKIPYSGYDMQLFIGDFTGDGRAEIMVRGAFGGSGGYEIAAIYTYKEDELKEIFNQNQFNSQYSCIASYQEGYKVEVICDQNKYVIDIKDRPKVYLDMIYTPEGKLKTKTEPIVSALNTAYPIKQVYNTYNELLIQQRIIGVANADTLGAIQTLLSLKDEEAKIISKNLLTFGEKSDEMRLVISLEEELLNKLPKGAEPISLGQREQEKSLIIVDLDEDGQEEIIFAYILNKIPCISIFKHVDNTLKVINTYKGKGKNIKDFDIIPYKNKRDILVGWHIRDQLSKLEVLEFKNSRFTNLVRNNIPLYEIIETKDFNEDGIHEIVLWLPAIDSAYNVQIYERNESMLRPTNKYNKMYYEKVKGYYENKLEDTPESGISLYYLADAQYKLEDYNGVIETLDKALELTMPYPSVKEVKRLQEISKQKISQ